MIERLGARPLVAINTHFHYDGGPGGNAAFAEAGATVWASDHTATLIKDRAEKQRTDMTALDKRFAHFTAAQPTRTFPAAKGLELQFFSETLEVKFPGAAHAPDNVVVWFPARKLLVGGCAVVAMPKFGNLADSDLKSWPAALEVMRAFKPDTVVPGHAEPGDAKLLDHTLKLVNAQKK